ncbi:MAG: DUF4058 family protein [Candidatus Viridilinea halotolerans]|uniref:DUF4058 family protein n=1 Tax=Candidatus Viridilinea halotolerans TaxID=2491704 RepID=A0A426U3N1_9CHLR|nr:MAG: DUF4058 family protein [Candidatus Viridilinea halotolerans]
MQPPFPGMDPYLEQPSLWPDVHHRLISAIGDQLQAKLSSGYRAVITPYVSFESIEIAPVRRVVPDVALVARGPFAAPGGSAVAVAAPEVAEAPLHLPAFMTVPVEYARIEIRTVRDQVLVTALELLSPANKRPGADGADAYEQKRQEIFSSTAHLMELDLLRGGRRPQVARPLPDAPYFIFLSRMEHRPQLEIWPLALDAAIPVVPVPLRYPDAPITLELGRAIHEAYQRARYDLEIDYREPPPLPELSAAEAAWLDEHLRAQGARGGRG